jgi:hypothetical protein
MNRPQTIEERLDRLERQNRVLERRNRVLTGACMLVPALVLFVGQASVPVKPTGVAPVKPTVVAPVGGVPLPQDAGKLMTRDMVEALKLKNEVLPIVKTKLLCLVDSEGKSRAVMSTDEHKLPVIALLDLNGTVRSEWRMSPEGTHLQMVATDGKPEVHLGKVGRANELQLHGVNSRVQMGEQSSITLGGASRIDLGGPNFNIMLDTRLGASIDLASEQNHAKLICGRYPGPGRAASGAFLNLSTGEGEGKPSVRLTAEAPGNLRPGHSEVSVGHGTKASAVMWATTKSEAAGFRSRGQFEGKTLIFESTIPDHITRRSPHVMFAPLDAP